MMRFKTSKELRRDLVVAARCLRAALPGPAAMKRAAIEHLRNKGRVRLPMEALSPRPETGFRYTVLNTARTGRPPEGRVLLPLEVTLDVEYHVPVRIHTPWGVQTEIVTVKRALHGKTWTCSSAPVGQSLLEMRAAADRYRCVLLVVRNKRSARDVLDAARRGSRILHYGIWKVDDIKRAEQDWRRPISSVRRDPAALAWHASAEYLRAMKATRSRRAITSRVTLLLTAAQKRAAKRLEDLVSSRSGPSQDEIGKDFELTRARVREIEAKALANLRSRERRR